jgi:iron complex outermembrane receptor protein
MQRSANPFANLGKLMRISLVVLTLNLTLFSITYAHNANAQAILDKKITLQLKNVSYQEIISALQKNHEVHFVYQASLFENLNRISVVSKDEKLKVLLDRIFVPKDIKYEISNEDYIILSKAETTATFNVGNIKSYYSGKMVADTLAEVSGVVSSHGNPVSGASVLMEGTSRGTTTDEHGVFVLRNVAIGKHNLLVSHVSYSNYKQSINVLADGLTVKVDLPGDPLQLQQVIMTSTGSPKKKIESSVAITTVSAEVMEDRAPLNSADAIKAIPGVMVSSSGGDGPGNVRVRGLPSAGGYQFFGIMEDGLPVLPTGFNSTPSPDQNFKADLTIKTIEAIRGGNAPLVMVNTAGALMNNISYTGAAKTYGKFKFTTGLSQEMFRLDGNMGGRISKKVQYNVGGFYRTDKGIRPPTYTANKGGQFKANLTWNFNDNGYIRVYTKYINDKVQWQLAGIYPFNPEHRAEAIGGYDLYKGTLVPSETKFAIKLPSGSTFNIDLEDGYRTQLAYGGLLFNYNVNGWNIKNNFRYQYNDISANFPLTAGVATFASDRDYYYTNGQKLTSPSGYYVNQQLSGTRRLEAQIIDYLDFTKRVGRHSLTLGGGIYVYNVLDNESVTAVISAELKNQPKVLLVGSPTATVATPGANGNPGGHTKFDGITKMSSVYAMDELAVSDKLRLEAGFRIDNFDLHGNKGLYSGSPVASGGTGFKISGMTPWSNNETYWSASVAANYKVNNSLAFYIRGTRSYNAFNIADFTAVDFNPANLKKREVLMGELGTKYFQRKFAVFSSLSYTTGSNLFQGLQIPAAAGGFIGQSTFASSRSISWETEVTYQLFKGLNLRLTSTVQDPIFTEHVFVVANDARADLAGQTLDWKGKRPQSTPLFNTQLGGTYDYKAFNLFFNAMHQSSFWSTSANTYKIPAFTDIVAGVAAKLFNRKVEVRSWVNNLLDTRALTEGNVRGEQFINEKDLVVGQTMLGRATLPRSFWLSLTYAF